MCESAKEYLQNLVVCDELNIVECSKSNVEKYGELCKQEELERIFKIALEADKASHYTYDCINCIQPVLDAVAVNKPKE